MKPLYSSLARWLRLIDDGGETFAEIFLSDAERISSRIHDLDETDPSGLRSADYIDGVVDGLAASRDPMTIIGLRPDIL